MIAENPPTIYRYIGVSEGGRPRTESLTSWQTQLKCQWECAITPCLAGGLQRPVVEGILSFQWLQTRIARQPGTGTPWCPQPHAPSADAALARRLGGGAERRSRGPSLRSGPAHALGESRGPRPPLDKPRKSAGCDVRTGRMDRGRALHSGVPAGRDS